MNSVLIIGGGGREHALLKALLRSDRPLCTFAYPGNPGMERDGCMLIEKKMASWDELADWAIENEIDLAIVGPEAPLVEGIVDVFKKHNIPVFGPSKAAAAIEGSKAFSKELMKKYGIPTADFALFTDKETALSWLHEKGAPIVVKVSGLAAGKGAIVCDTIAAAEEALGDIFDKKLFGEAGATVILEEKMVGEEASIFVISDGRSYRILPAAQDHKAVGNGDTGPNTGGMGAYAPAPVVTPKLLSRIEREIITPTLAAMEKEGCRYQGLLFCGIMLTTSGPRVVEYNCRFGDPETQAVLPLVSCDWFDLFRSAAAGRLSSKEWTIAPGYCAAVIMASKGYPGSFEKGLVISGLDETERSRENLDVYHSGTTLDTEERIVTSGGRVLAVASWAATLAEAVTNAYQGVASINFSNNYYRSDIAAKGIARLTSSRN